MREVLDAYPGAQRALFRRYHIGGCSSCAFQPSETLEQLCSRNNSLNVAEVLKHIQSSHEQDAQILISHSELAELRTRNPRLKLLDVRSREEFEAVRIEGSVLMSQPSMQEIMARWPRDEAFVIIDHQGKYALDAAAYFLGHGFTNVRCLRGGIDAWSQEVDQNVPRYRLEPASTATTPAER
ncbi:MAG: rhodanese-like domain-containing protein [Verrucomicrobia bacterium]|nr:rhodanese-like domain-containing protein [Verrucomicrobiota bacterium]